MKPSKISLYAAGAVIVLAVSISVYRHFHQEDPAIKRDVERSVVAEKQFHEQETASVKLDTAVAKIERTRKKTLDAANVIHVVADTLGQNSQSVRDSLAMWRSRDSLHKAEGDSLRKVIHADSVQKGSLTRDRNRWHVVADSLEAVNSSLLSDVKKLNGDCHLLPFVPCPSRKASFVAGVVTELVIANQFRHPPKLKSAVVFAH